MKFLTLAASLLIFACTAFSQTTGNEPRNDFKGVRRIYVDTGKDEKARKRIVKKIEKAALGLEILTTAEGAELVLTFTAKRVAPIAKAAVQPPLVKNMPGRISITYQNVDQGEGSVQVQLPDGERRDVYFWSGGPAEKFAAYFIDSYKKANKAK